MDTNKYAKIELLIKDKNGSINKLTLENCNYQFSGNFIIISTIDKLFYETFQIFDLGEVKSYKTYENNKN